MREAGRVELLTGCTNEGGTREPWARSSILLLLGLGSLTTPLTSGTSLGRGVSGKVSGQGVVLLVVDTLGTTDLVFKGVKECL